MRVRVAAPIMLPLSLALSLALIAQGVAETPSQSWKVTWEPVQLVNGSPVLFRVAAPATLKLLQGTWLGHQLSFRFDQECTCWYAIAGISLDAKAGKFPLQLESEAGPQIFPVEIEEKIYPTTEITVPPKYVRPPPEVLHRIEEEELLKKKAFSETAPEAVWSGRFQPPVRSIVTAQFGTSRTYNGAKQGLHQGIDFRAATGTLVRAANQGTVIMAHNLYYEGNCVMIDHGQGLLTIYMHLSEIQVKEGDKVETGQTLGRSGSTGRVTGPHVHFAARWQGIYLDPATLLDLRLPGLSPQ